jgi:hypothetical protein
MNDDYTTSQKVERKIGLAVIRGNGIEYKGHFSLKR